MWAILVVGVIFVVAAVSNLFGSEPDPTGAIASAVVAAILIGLFFGTRFHERKADEFDAWLNHNLQAVARGGAFYNDVLITPATVVTRYQIAVSFLIITFKFPTRFYVVGHDATRIVATVCTLGSLVLGWWGIPWGPIYTVQVVTRNLRGGFRHSVSALLAGATSAEIGAG